MPYPTFAQEIRQMQEERRRREPPPKRIHIDSLIVKSDSPLLGTPVQPAIVQKLIAESSLAPGSIFNPRLLEQFFQRNRSVLPADASRDNDVQSKVNEQEGTVDITMDFRPCPK